MAKYDFLSMKSKEAVSGMQYKWIILCQKQTSCLVRKEFRKVQDLQSMNSWKGIVYEMIWDTCYVKVPKRYLKPTNIL